MRIKSKYNNWVACTFSGMISEHSLMFCKSSGDLELLELDMRAASAICSSYKFRSEESKTRRLLISHSLTTLLSHL